MYRCRLLAEVLAEVLAEEEMHYRIQQAIRASSISKQSPNQPINNHRPKRE